MRGTRGLLDNLGMLTASQIAAQLLTLWALVFLAERLGAHWFGVVQIGVAFLLYALTIAEWGMFALGVREVARLDEPAEVLRYARTHTGLVALQALAAVGLGLLVLPRLPFWSADPWVFMLYLAVVLPQVFIHGWIAQGLERMPWVGAVRSLRSLAYAVFVLVLLDPLATATGLAAHRWVPLLFFAAMVVGNVVIGTVLRRWFGRWVLPALPDRREMARRWRETAPLGAAAVVLRVVLSVDLLVLGSLAAPEVAGHYAAASRMIFLLVVAGEVLWAALLPRMSRTWARDQADFRRAFNLFLGFFLAGVLPLAVGGVLTGADLVDLLYGAEYAAAGPIARILAVAYALLVAGRFLGNTLVAMDRQTAFFVPVLVTAVLAVALTAGLVPRHGAPGAAWAMLGAHGTLALVMLVVARRLFTAALARLALALAGTVAVMGFAVDACAAWHVGARIAVGGAVYLLLAGPVLLRFRGALRRGEATA